MAIPMQSDLPKDVIEVVQDHHLLVDGTPVSEEMNLCLTSTAMTVEIKMTIVEVTANAAPHDEKAQHPLEAPLSGLAMTIR